MFEDGNYETNPNTAIIFKRADYSTNESGPEYEQDGHTSS
jgi:hypothetical protein